MNVLYTVGDLRRHIADMRDDIMLVDGASGDSCLFVGEVDEYFDTDTGQEKLGLPLGGLDVEDEDEGDSKPTLKIVK